MDEDVHGPGDGDGDLIGALQGQGFGHQLTEQHIEVGDEREGQGDGDDVGVEMPMAEAAERLLDEAGDGGLSQPSQGEAAEGDSELHRGQEVAHVFLQAADDAGTGFALGDELLDARLADADEGELRRHKEAVRQNQEHDGEAVEEEKLRHWLRV